MSETENQFGAFVTEEGLTLPEIWQQLHSNQCEWLNVPRNAKFYELREFIDQSDRQAIRQLRQVPNERWQHVCYGAGWTPLGAIALSWCSGLLDLSVVSQAWSYTGQQVQPDEAILRAISFSNPDIIPRINRLSEAVTLTGQDLIGCALVLGAADKVEIDVAEIGLADAPEEIRPILDHVQSRLGKNM